MSDFLERLRQKPPRERRLVALIVSGAVVGIIFVIWATMLATTISNDSGGAVEATDTDSYTTMFDSLKGQFQTLSDGFSSVTAQFQEGLGSTTAPVSADPDLMSSTTATSSFMEEAGTSSGNAI